MWARAIPGLSPDTRLMLANLNRPVHIRVFVTYGCPYCPSAVRLAHKLAMASDLITAEGISSEEFPELGEPVRRDGSAQNRY